MSEDALSSTCSFSLPRDGSSPLDHTTLNCQEPLPFPVGPISHSALVHWQTSGNKVTAWKACHSVTQFSDSVWHSAPHHTSPIYFVAFYNIENIESCKEKREKLGPSSPHSITDR